MQVQPFAQFDSLDSVAALVSDEARPIAPVTLADGLKAAALLFVAAIVQVSIFTQVAHASAASRSSLLVTSSRVALLRGSVVGATAASSPGSSSTRRRSAQLGLTSLVLTVAGYWIGRYGETTGRDRAHAPFLSVAVVTILYSFGAARSSTSCSASARRPVRSCAGLLPTIVLNLILTAPVYALVRRLLRPRERARLRDRGAAPWLARRRERPPLEAVPARRARASSSRTA